MSTLRGGRNLPERSFARAWVERDLQRGDLSLLTDFAFFRNSYPPSVVVDRLCERGFGRKPREGAPG